MMINIFFFLKALSNTNIILDSRGFFPGDIIVLSPDPMLTIVGKNCCFNLNMNQCFLPKSFFFLEARCPGTKGNLPSGTYKTSR